MARGRAYPIESGAALAVGPYLVEAFLDTGGGFTTDSRDTGGIAQTLAGELRDRGAGGLALWVLQGPGAGRSVPLGRHRPPPSPVPPGPTSSWPATTTSSSPSTPGARCASEARAPCASGARRRIAA
ncbi:MAG: hypothetical protein R3F43_06590 [bacterium]